ncbi:MAG: hypothetical protein ACHQ3P_08450 [Candidatus Limnocylindrales bacterium]
MAKIHYAADGSIPAERFIAALTDFSPDRPRLWPNLSPKFYAVHQVGPDWADVNEGTDFLGGVWAHERYDWSTPGVVELTLQDSPSFEPGTKIVYRVTPRDGGCHVEVDFQRAAHGFKGRLVGVLVELGGSRQFSAQLRETLARLDREAAGGSTAATT